jgi:hypothetical protein
MALPSLNFHSTHAASVVQRQLDAYNDKNIEALLATYAPDAELYEHPCVLLAKGTDALRERFLARFREPDLHAALLRRIVTGNFVIDHEWVTRNFPDGRGTLELTMIYEVKSARIARAWMIVGPKQLPGDQTNDVHATVVSMKS